MHRWLGGAPPDELGIVAHGPAILAGSAADGAVAGLRCVFAHPTGLDLAVVVVASGNHVAAMERPRGHDGVASDPLRSLALVVEVNGRRGPAFPYRGQGSASDYRCDRQADYWIPELPGDGEVRITTSWPEIGLQERTCTLHCAALDDLAGRVQPLLTPQPEPAPTGTGQVTVPDLVGLDVDAARRVGRAAGLVVTAADLDGPPLGTLTSRGVWTVTAQHPAAGTHVDRGDPVTVHFEQRG